MRVHDREQGMGLRLGSLVVEPGAEDCHEPGRAGAGGYLTGRDREPALHLGRLDRRRAPPCAGIGIALCEIGDDGVGIGQDDPVVLDRRHLAERADL